MSTFSSTFAENIYHQKYAMAGEHWPDTVDRVVSNVMGAVDMADSKEASEIRQLMIERKFMPGGRYLYAAGREMNQTQNCALYRAQDTREGWADLQRKVSMALMTGAGVGVDYSDVRASGSKISRTGGVASGPLSLMKIVNEIGRNVMQGGARRSAIWAGLSWSHSDIFYFIDAKDWSDDVKALKEKDFTFPAQLDMTNISVILDKEFFEAFEGRKEGFAPDGRTWQEWAKDVYDRTVEHMVTTAEPGFSVNYDNPRESLRNAPLAADTTIYTDGGLREIGDVVGEPVTVWTGLQWADDVVFKKTGESTTVVVQMTGGRTIEADPTHPFMVERYSGAGARRRLVRTDRVPAKDLRPGDVVAVSLPSVPEPTARSARDYTLGYAYGDGSFSGSGADITFCTDDSKKCIPFLVEPRGGTASDTRGYARYYYDIDGADTLNKERITASISDIPSFIAGLWDADGNVSPDGRIRLSNKSPEFLADVRRLLESVGILSHVSKNGFSMYGGSQTYQLVIASDSHDDFVSLIPAVRTVGAPRSMAPYRQSLVKVVKVSEGGSKDVYCADVGVEEHTFMAEGVIVSNCTEITSEDDSDICNLGSLNLAAFDNEQEFADAVELATLFLLAGTVYSILPHEEVYETREKNRRLGLGLMGVHEWLLKRGKRYGPDEELGSWLDEYAQSGTYANGWAKELDLSAPLKTRAIAPNGTIGILAETTTSAEPIFAAAYKRRVRNADPNADTIGFEYVVDPTAARLVEEGVDPDLIEDAYSLSYDVERRIAFQAWLQQYVDHGISSTVNLPSVKTHAYSPEDFGKILYPYLPKLRGITAYPDGARAGQPLTPVPLEFALDKVGVRYEENEEACVGGLCGV